MEARFSMREALPRSNRVRATAHMLLQAAKTRRINRVNKYRAPTMSRDSRGRERQNRSHLAVSSKEKQEMGSTMIMTVEKEITIEASKTPSTARPK